MSPQQSTATLDPLLTPRQCASALNIGLSTFWKMVADGALPKPIKLGASSRWTQSEIASVIDGLKAKRGRAAQ